MRLDYSRCYSREREKELARVSMAGASCLFFRGLRKCVGCVCFAECSAKVQQETWGSDIDIL